MDMVWKRRRHDYNNLVTTEAANLLNEGKIVWLDFFHINPNFALAVQIILAAHKKLQKKKKMKVLD